jgi:drug/metabolite transporter (DMT)-like permease
VYSILPLAAAVCLTGYNLITRFVGRNENPWTSLFYTALFGAVFLSAIVPFFWTPLTGYTAGLVIVIGILGTASQLMLIRALTLGEAGLLAPFVYVGLLFATFWGYVIFDDVPDVPTIIGALIIVGSGLYVWYREIQTTPKGR